MRTFGFAERWLRATGEITGPINNDDGPLRIDDGRVWSSPTTACPNCLRMSEEIAGGLRRCYKCGVQFRVV